jgi:hypothetical protein
MWEFKVIHRMNTRSTSYSKRSILTAIEKAGLTATQDGMILTVTAPSIESRRELERQLQMVDRGVVYRIERMA